MFVGEQNSKQNSCEHRRKECRWCEIFSILKRWNQLWWWNWRDLYLFNFLSQYRYISCTLTYGEKETVASTSTRSLDDFDIDKFVSKKEKQTLSKRQYVIWICWNCSLTKLKMQSGQLKPSPKKKKLLGVNNFESLISFLMLFNTTCTIFGLRGSDEWIQNSVMGASFYKETAAVLNVQLSMNDNPQPDKG